MPMSLSKIVFFDECHKKYEIGQAGLTSYSFPRDEDGLYIKNGVIADVDMVLLWMLLPSSMKNI
jgi:hypothetical protein